MGDKVGNKVGDKNINSRTMNETQSRILEEIRNNPNITKRQLQEKIGKGKTTVDNGITYLRENGYIEHIGSNKAGYWKIINSDK